MSKNQIILKKLQIIPFLLLTVASHIMAAQNTAIITGQVRHFTLDSIKIVLQENPVIWQKTTYSAPVTEGQFKAELLIDRPTFCYITDGENYINGLLESGDCVEVTYDTKNPGDLMLKGKGSEKFSFLIDYRKFNFYKRISEEVSTAKTMKYPFDHLFNFVDSAGAVFLKRLDETKPLISTASYELLRAEILANTWGNKYRAVTMVYHENIDETLSKRPQELTPQLKEQLKNILRVDETLYYSYTYLNEVYSILFRQYDGLVLDGKASKNLPEKYDYLSRFLPGRLKVPVLTMFLDNDIGKLNQAEHLEILINQIYISPHDAIYRSYIEKRYNDVISFRKGMPAPEFTLEDEKGKKVSLASLRGKVVYIDFWFAKCGPCHSLFTTIGPVKKQFINSDVVFLNISIDNRDTWLDALKKYNIPGYHVFTEGKEASHPVITSYKVGSYPTTCLIDRNGNIFSATPPSNPGELARQIEDALHIPGKDL